MCVSSGGGKGNESIWNKRILRRKNSAFPRERKVKKKGEHFHTPLSFDYLISNSSFMSISSP